MYVPPTAHRHSMRHSTVTLPLILLTILAASCARGIAAPPADAVVEGRVQPTQTDTVDASATVSIDKARWLLRETTRTTATRDFWDEIAVLDMPAAQRVARSLDERTFVLALRTLMMSDPDAASVAFRALHVNAADRAVRAGSRIGLTMALSWQSNWPALATIGTDPDSLDTFDPLAVQAGVERWGRALAAVPPPTIYAPTEPVTLPMRRSEFGTPVITVLVNGRPHEFWLDTGASMTLLSADVALDAGVMLASRDSLALGVVSGHIPARAAVIDSLSFGPVVVRGIGAAVVNQQTLRLDHRIVNGVRQQVPIDGVIGTDILRYLDLVLDSRAGTLTLRRPRLDPKARRNLYWVGYPVVRLVTRDGRSALFGLDTGAEGTYVTTSLLKKLPQTRVALRRGTIGGLGAEVQRTEWIARDVALSDGDYAMALRNVPVAPERRWTFVTFDGIIGSDVALATRMHLDFLNGVFDIRRSDAPSNGITVTIGRD